MALSIVQTAHRARVDADSTTLSVPGVSAGSLLVLTAAVFHASPSSGGTITITDDKGNTWQAAVQAQGDAQSKIHLWYAMNVAGGTTVVTLDTNSSGAAPTIEFDVIEVGGAALTSALDKTVTGSGNDFAPVISSGTLAQADEIIFAMVSHTEANSTITQDADYTLIGENEDNNSGQTYNAVYKIVATVTSDEAGWVLQTPGRAWFDLIATFKQAAAGGGVVAPQALHHYKRRRAA